MIKWNIFLYYIFKSDIKYYKIDYEMSVNKLFYKIYDQKLNFLGSKN